MDLSRSLFLSYRRDLAFAWTKLLWRGLRDADIDAFLDLEDLTAAGNFDTRIFTQIEARPYFVPVLVAGSLDRCDNPDNWQRQELEHAVSTHRTIVPFAIQGFDYADARKHLPPDIARALTSANGVNASPDFFDEAVRQLIEDRLQPTAQAVVPLSSEDLAYAEAARRRAEKALHPSVPAPSPSPSPRPAPGPPPGPPPSPAPPPPPPTPPPPPHRRMLIAGAAGLVVIATALVVWFATRSSNETHDHLNANGSIAIGDELRSDDGRTVLTMLDTGQLSAATDNVRWWTSDELSERGTIAYMQEDGNFVIYSSADNLTADGALWSTRSQGHPGARLVVGEHRGGGWVGIFGPHDEILWQQAQFPDQSAGAPPSPSSEQSTVPSSTEHGTTTIDTSPEVTTT